MVIPPNPLSKEDMERIANTAKLGKSSLDILNDRIANLPSKTFFAQSWIEEHKKALSISSIPASQLYELGLTKSYVDGYMLLSEIFEVRFTFQTTTFTSKVLAMSGLMMSANLDIVETLSNNYLKLAKNTLSIANSLLNDILLIQNKQLEEVSRVIYPILENQIKIVSQGIGKHTNLFNKLITEYSKISIGSQIDLEKNRFNFQFKHETYIEEQQVAIKLKDGKVENDLVEFQDIEFQGKDYKILLVPNTKYSEFKNQYSSLSLEFNKTSLIIGTATKETILFKEKDIKYNYNKTTKTITLGPYNHSLINREAGERQTRATKNFRFIHFVLDYISNDLEETLWYFENLEAEYEGNQYIDLNNNKRWKNTFDRLLLLLPKEMKDIFIIGNDYIKLNEKYR